MEKTIYDLKLHESLKVENLVGRDDNISLIVTRVPGGWIYHSMITNYYSQKTGNPLAPVFIPIHTEFEL